MISNGLPTGHGAPRAMRMRVATLRHRSSRMFPHLLMLLTLMHIANAKYFMYLTGHVILNASMWCLTDMHRVDSIMLSQTNL
jgi:hypothetical protein